MSDDPQTICLKSAAMFQRQAAELYEVARLVSSWSLGHAVIIEAQRMAAQRARLSRMMLYYAGVISDRDF